MTKIACLSDIHGNSDALVAVLGEAQNRGVTYLFICGDIAGYYYDTATAWKILSSWDVVMCHGNHETILSEWVGGTPERKEQIRLKYGSSYRLAAETMDKHDLNSLLSLKHPVPIQVDGISFLLSHGAPWDENAYVYPDMKETDRDNFVAYIKKYSVILIGHTHYQFAERYKDSLILNPGSVGQPRSGKEADTALCRAQWALFDTESGHYDLMTTLYDPSRIIRQVDLYDSHLPYLKSVLKRTEAAR